MATATARIHLALSALPLLIRGDGAQLPLAPRDAVLLAWLAVEGPTGRDQLATLLWPNSERGQALTTLRQRLFHLRRNAGAELAQGTPVLQLAEGVTHDLLAAHTLLGSTTLADAPALEAWLAAQRQQRLRRQVEGLQAQAKALEQSGAYEAALPLAREVLKLDPLSEAAHRHLIRLLYLAGDRAAALLAFDACAAVLWDELGVRPTAATLELLATLSGEAPPPVRAGSGALPAAVLRPPRLVDREAELALLSRGWQAGHVVAVLGEAGVGKSRLVGDWSAGVPGLLRCAAQAGDAPVPYALVGRLLRARCELPPPGLAPEERAALARLVPEWADTEEGPACSYSRAVAALLRAGEGTAGLVLDDLHAADAASLELLQALLTQPQAPLPCVLAWRPADAGPALQALQEALAGQARLEPVLLRPLGEAAVAALVDEAGVGASGVDLAPRLLALTGGNPLFVLETLKQAWVEDQARGDAPRMARLPHAASVVHMIERRVARLEAESLALARVAALAGVDFSLPLAEKVMARPAIALADALAALETAQVMDGTRFVHDLVLDAVRRGIPRAVAQAVHGQIAAWVESAGGEPARLAAHWLAAGEPARALAPLKRAVMLAWRADRVGEASAFLLQAASIEEDLGQRAEAFQTLLTATHEGMLEFLDQRSEEYLRRLQRLAATPLEQAIVEWVRGNLLSMAGRHDQARALLEQVAPVMRRDGGPFWQMEADGDLAITLALLSDFEAAWPLFERVEATVAANTGLAIPPGFHSNYALALDYAGRVREGHLHRLAELQQCGPGRERAMCLAMLAVNRLAAGDAEACLVLAEESLRHYALLDVPAARALSPSLVAARAERRLGRWAAAARRLEGLGDPARLGATARCNLRIVLAESWADQGRVGPARKLLEEALAGPGANPRMVAAIAFERARLARWRGEDPGRLEQAIDELLGPSAYPDARLRAQIEDARTLPPPQALATLQRAGAQAAAFGLEGLEWLAQVVSLEVLRHFDPSRGAEVAVRVMNAAGPLAGGGLYLPEAWLAARLAFQAAGDDRAADACVVRALAWVEERVRQGDVAPEFVETFVHRHPVHEQLRSRRRTAFPS